MSGMWNSLDSLRGEGDSETGSAALSAHCDFLFLFRTFKTRGLAYCLLDLLQCRLVMLGQAKLGGQRFTAREQIGPNVKCRLGDALAVGRAAKATKDKGDTLRYAAVDKEGFPRKSDIQEAVIKILISSKGGKKQKHKPFVKLGLLDYRFLGSLVIGVAAKCFEPGHKEPHSANK